MMQTIIKTLISLAVILAATFIAKKNPGTAGLIGVMPLTGLLVVVWVYAENREKPEAVLACVQGALIGLLPTFLFFGALFAGLRSGLPFALSIGIGAAVWFAGAMAHRHFMN